MTQDVGPKFKSHYQKKKKKKTPQNKKRKKAPPIILLSLYPEIFSNFFNIHTHFLRVVV
jgi:hypothetical protein